MQHTPQIEHLPRRFRRSPSTPTHSPERHSLWRRLSNACGDLFEGMPPGVVVIYLLAIALQFLVFSHGDLIWTVVNSYAYLDGHILDFYGYNASRGVIAAYLPLLYVIFAVWMAPVKLLLSPAAPVGVFTGIGELSSWEIAWAKLLILIVFLISAHLLKLIAREAFPGRPQAQRNATIAYLLSPFAAFSFNVFSGYDVIGVCLTLAGVLYYLRGDRWKFAVYFGLAASAKYFAFILFAPLILLAYKRLRDLVLLSGVAVLVVASFAAPYLPSKSFREDALLMLVQRKVDAPQGPTVLAEVICLIGCVVLWRIRATRENLARIAILSATTVYGLFFTAVRWHPQWFILLSPFFALAVGLLRRPTRFIVWESIGFLAYLWTLAYIFKKNVDFNMVTNGPMRDFFGSPMLFLSDFYSPEAAPFTQIALLVFCISPIAFWVLELADGFSAGSEANRDVAVSRPAWYLRALTLPVTFTLPALLAVLLPVSLADSINPSAWSVNLASQVVCQPVAQAATPYAGSANAFVAQQEFSPLHDELAGASVRIATWYKSVGGSVEFVLRESGGEEISRTTAGLGPVVDNGELYAHFPHPIRLDPAATYILEINTGAASGRLGLWGTSGDCVADRSLAIDGAVQPGDLGLTLYFAQP